MIRQRILEGWNSFRAAAFPNGAPELQLKELRCAFFSGALVATNVCVRKGGAAETEEEGLKVLGDLQAEFDGYLERVKKGVV